MTEETKGNKKSADEYANSQGTNYPMPKSYTDMVWKQIREAYKAGATAEYLRSEQVIVENDKEIERLSEINKGLHEACSEISKERAKFKIKSEASEQVIKGLVEALKAVKIATEALTSYYNSTKLDTNKEKQV